MKKMLAIFLTICMLASTLCIPAFAEEPVSGVVLRVSAVQKNGVTVVLNDYRTFEEGWNSAIVYALTDNYERVVVDLYANWSAVGGVFGDDDGEGFDNETIYIPDDVKITINMNGHTINRGLTEWVSDGEVMYIDDDADVIINDGTITGGWSSNGAGGIHVKDDVRLTLNDVHIIGNTADDSDGAGIALCSDAVFTMNGGSFQDNYMIGITKGDYGGAIYINDGTATFKDVLFKNNHTPIDENYGTAIYADDSRVTLNNCTFEGNGLDASYHKYYQSVIYACDSTFTVTGCTFKNNRCGDLVFLKDSALSMASSVFTGITDTDNMIDATLGSSIYITDTIFADNSAHVISVDGGLADDSFFRNCTFKNTKGRNGYAFGIYNCLVTFFDCDFGDSVFDKQYILITNSPVTREDAVIGVRGILPNGATSFTDYYKDFVSGWSAAIGTAITNTYDRIVVDLYGDWTASDGEFCDSGVGFDWDAIHFPANVKVTLNMNGHTINRGLEAEEDNGEVICIDENAEVVINDGTIKGGYSDNGAGGIHIKSGAKVTLNNVHVVENAVEGDDGAGIAVYDGATLVMKGGSISRNTLDRSFILVGVIPPAGALYADNATVILDKVTISDNDALYYGSEGVAIYAKNSIVAVNECTISGNAVKKGEDRLEAESVIEAVGSELIITNTNFTGNGSTVLDPDSSHDTFLLSLQDSSLAMENCRITGNSPYGLFFFNRSDGDLRNVTITDNNSFVLRSWNEDNTVTMTKCVLNNNTPADKGEDIKKVVTGTLVMLECSLGDTSFVDKGDVDFGDGVNSTASIFGEGSLTMIIAFTALIAAVASLLVNVSARKKAVPAAAANAADDEDEDEE